MNTSTGLKPKLQNKVKSCDGKAACENCKGRQQVKQNVTKLKPSKPMIKVGCWNGLFAGTLDF
jgi:hypothetical protein